MFRIKFLLACYWILHLFLGNSIFAEEIDLALRDRFLDAMRETDTLRTQLNIRVRLDAIWQQSAATINGGDYSPEVLAKMRTRGEYPEKIVLKREYAVRGDSIFETGVRDNGTTFVSAKNGDYAFYIARGSGLDAFTIHWLEQRGVNPAAEKSVETAAAATMASVPGVWNLFGEPISQLIASDTFMIQTISKLESNGEALVRIEFTRLVDKLLPGRPSIVDAYLICDPARHWAFREYAATLADITGKAFSRRQVLLEVEMVGGLPFATTQTATFTRLGVPDGIDRGTTKLEILSNDVPRETFRLSGYGLPEPKFKQGLIGMWVWYLIAGIVCFGASGIIVKRRRAQG